MTPGCGPASSSAPPTRPASPREWSGCCGPWPRPTARPGTPITTHTPTPPQPWGLEQQRILAEEGVDLSQVVIGHSGGTLDTAYHEAILANGSYLGFDHFGIGTFSVAERVEVGQGAVRAGPRRPHRAVPRRHVPRRLVPARRWPSAWKEWRWTHIPDDVLPEMRTAGISEDGHHHHDGGQPAPHPRGM